MSKPRKADNMKPEYDFSAATRGKFHRDDLKLIQPVHLEADVLAWLQARADAQGVSLSQYVNEMLRKDIAQVEAAD
jgi:hypothetical protein